MRTLVFADLHFEKGSSYARGRQFLPPYDTRATLLRMARAVARHKPARVIALGDSFHDRDAADRLGDGGTRPCWTALGKAAHFIWIAGNHDPHPPAWLGGEITDGYAAGRADLPARTAGDLPCRRGGGASASLRQRGQMGPQRAAALFCLATACG